MFCSDKTVIFSLPKEAFAARSAHFQFAYEFKPLMKLRKHPSAKRVLGEHSAMNFPRRFLWRIYAKLSNSSVKYCGIFLWKFHADINKWFISFPILARTVAMTANTTRLTGMITVWGINKTNCASSILQNQNHQLLIGNGRWIQ